MNYFMLKEVYSVLWKTKAISQDRSFKPHTISTTQDQKDTQEMLKLHKSNST